MVTSKVDGQNHILSGERADNKSWIFVYSPVPEPAGFLIGSVAGVNELAAEPGLEFLDSQHKGRDFNS